MAPASVWVRIGATRINELITVSLPVAERPNALEFSTTSPTGVSSGHSPSRYAGV